jgi:septum site-determining protein MinD
LARIIAVASGKGGVGKTSVALNLATALAQNFNKNVVLIDCNVTTSHLGMYLGMYYSPVTLNKALRGEVSINDALYDHVGGMKVVPASLSLSDLEGVDVTKLREKINAIAGENDVILLDGAPGLGREAIAALKAADEVLFVTTPYVPSVMDVVRTMEVVNEIGIKPVGIVLNMVHDERYEMTPQEVEQLTRVPVIASIPFDKNVHKSMVEKLPILVFRPNSKASKALIRLGATLIDHPYEEKSGIFSRIVNKLRRKKKYEALPTSPDMGFQTQPMLPQPGFRQPGPPALEFPQDEPTTPGIRPPKPDE